MPQTAPSLESTVRLPRAIRAQSERVRAMTEPPAPAPDDTTPPAAPATEPAPPIESHPAPEPSQPAAATPTPQPPADPRENDPAYWAQRFRVTQGMLERERRERVADQERAQQQQNELREQLRQAQAAQPASSGVDLSQFFTPEQIEQYGPDQCQTLAHVAIKAAREQTQAAMQPIREQQERQQETATREKRNAFFDALGQLVPDYEQVDASEPWRLWLAEHDETTGMVRQDILNRHMADSRADRVARMFTQFKATLVPQAAPPVAPAGRAGAQQASMRPQPTKGYPSAAEIRDFYKRAAIGKVKDAERQEFEARMQAHRPAA
jgi:hypothetical protein